MISSPLAHQDVPPRRAALPRATWLGPAGLVGLSLVPLIGGGVRLAQLAGVETAPPEAARFVADPVPVVLHIVAATVFSLVGAFQFTAAIRRRYPRWHKVAGRVLLPAGLVVAISGLWMTVTYPWPPGDGLVVAMERLFFGGAMLVSLLVGVDALRRREFKEHGDWMVRAYAIGLAAGTQVFTHLPWFILIDQQPGETPRAVMMGLGWVINIAVAEWVIRRPTLEPNSIRVAVQ